jgi:putative flavoprotein involved in K+ transport
MTVGEVVGFLEGYASSFDAPVCTNTTVKSVARCEGGFRVESDGDLWETRCVVIATGHSDVPSVPAVAESLPAEIGQVTPSEYKRPEDLPRGGVLVVGASATGIQIADELRRSGRDVVLSVGRHIRLPRRHRDKDIMWWLDRIGVLAERVEDMPDVERARSQPSFQLVGRPDGRSIDLASLSNQGVRLVGRACEVDGTSIRFADDLCATVEAAERKLNRLLERIDRFAGTPVPETPERVRVRPAASSLNLRREGIGSVVWATGYRRYYPWLSIPVLNDGGEIVHHGGLTPCPGLFAIGLRLLRRRNSSFLDGVGRDAEELTIHILAHLEQTRCLAA